MYPDLYQSQVHICFSTHSYKAQPRWRELKIKTGCLVSWQRATLRIGYKSVHLDTYVWGSLRREWWYSNAIHCYRHFNAWKSCDVMLLSTTWKGGVALCFAEKIRVSCSDKKKDIKCVRFTAIHLVLWITMSCYVCYVSLIWWPLRIHIFCWTNVCSRASVLNKCLVMVNWMGDTFEDVFCCALAWAICVTKMRRVVILITSKQNFTFAD